MKEKLSKTDLNVLEVVARVRGLRAEIAVRYPKLKSAGNPEALRKRMERLCVKGYLASSDLPVGSKIFRLSAKGVELLGAAAAMSNAPTAGIAAEMLAISMLAWKVDQFVFLTKAELEKLVHTLSKCETPP